MRHLPTDDEISGFVCRVSSTGLPGVEQSTTVSPDIYADGSVTVQAHIGFPIVGGMARAYQIMNDGRRGRRIDACVVDTDCITNNEGRAVLGLRDISRANETYSGVIELWVDGGTTQSVSDIANPKAYTASPAYRTWIAYAPQKRSAEPKGIDLGTVVVNAETSLAASFAEGFKRKEPGTSLLQTVTRAHALIAQRLTSCTCLLENKVTHEAITPHPYNDPSGACYVDLNNLGVAQDIRRVVPSSLANVSALRNSLVDRLALLHVGYQLRSNAYDLSSSPDARVKLNDYTWSLGLDALDGVWNGKDLNDPVGVGSGISLQPKEHRSLLVHWLIDWLNDQARLPIANYSQANTGLLLSLMQCSNALFDAADVADVYDWRDPHVTLERTNGSGTLLSPTFTVRVNASDDDIKVETLEFAVQQASAKGAPDSALGVAAIIKTVVLPQSTNTYALTLPTCAGRTKLVATVRDSANRVSTATIANIACDNVAPVFTRFVQTAPFQDHTSGTVSFNTVGAYVHAGSTSVTIDPSTLLSDTGLSFTTYVDLAGDPLHVPHLYIANSDQDAEPVIVEYAFIPYGSASPPQGWRMALPLDGSNLVKVPFTVEALCSSNVLCQEGLIKRLEGDQFNTLKIRMRDTTGNMSPEKTVRVFSTYHFPPVQVVETKWASSLSALNISSSYIVDTLFAVGTGRYAPLVEHTIDFPVPSSAGWLPSVIALRVKSRGASFSVSLDEYRTGMDPDVIDLQQGKLITPCTTGTSVLGDRWQLADASGTGWLACTDSYAASSIVVKSSSGRSAIFTVVGIFPDYLQANSDPPVKDFAMLLPGRSPVSVGWGSDPVFSHLEVNRTGFVGRVYTVMDPEIRLTRGDMGPKINAASYVGPSKIRTMSYSSYWGTWEISTYRLHAEVSKITVAVYGSLNKTTGVDVEHLVPGQANTDVAVIYASGAPKTLDSLVIQ